MENKKKKICNRNFLKILIIVFIILIFILLSIVSSKFGKIDIPIPTGNVDIFDINVCCNNQCDNKSTNTDDKNDTSVDSRGKTKSGSVIISDKYSKNDTDVTGTFGVFDDDIEWYDESELNIFKNYAYRIENMIAPGDSNTYNFIVRNNNQFPIKYTFKVSEDNKYNVNMKYRLKQNGHYVIGDSNHWVSYQELIVSDALISAKSKTLYSLDWKWVDSSQDNYAGQAIDAIYKLLINVNAEQYIK